MRGVAAVSVMIFHRRDWFGGDVVFGHAFLAVDFFFLLSGFIIAHAYDQRLSAPHGNIRFLKDRFIRLFPMLFLGAVLAACAVVTTAAVSQTPLPPLFVATFFGHMVAFPVIWGTEYLAFPWNLALWSLFWELVVNLLYVLMFRYLTPRRLIVFTFSCCALMFFVAQRRAGFQVGFTRETHGLLLGLPRVCAAFFLGVSIKRFVQIETKYGPATGLTCIALLMLSFLVPIGWSWSTLYDPLIAYVAYPPLLIVAASSRSALPSFYMLLGAVSYPLYVIHEPSLKLLNDTLATIGFVNGAPSFGEAALLLSVVALLAYLAARFYDEPLRRKLRQRFAREGVRNNVGERTSG
jgi:peptidoglycan/LPS O-acetylase OafA/YrhL